MLDAKLMLGGFAEPIRLENIDITRFADQINTDPDFALVSCVRECRLVNSHCRKVPIGSAY